MVGPGKRKRKKNKGKSNNAHESDYNKQHGTLRPKLDPGQRHIDDSGGTKESGKKSLPPRSWDVDSMLEEIVIQKIELLYKKAEEKLVELGNGIDEARRAILMNGSVFGGANILSNIVSNALVTIEKAHVTDGKIGVEPIFEDVHELVSFSLQTLITMIVQGWPETTKTEAILYLLQSNSLAVQGSPVDPSPSTDDKDLGHKNASEIDIGKILKENTACLSRLSTSPTPLSSPPRKQNVATYVSEPQIHNPRFTPGESLSSDFESNGFDFLKSLVNCPDEIRVEDWLRNCSEDSKGNIILNLAKEVENLTTQEKERREWAEKVVIQTAKRFNAIRTELRDLRLDKNETDRLLKQKEEHHDYSSILSGRQNNLKKVMYDLDSVNQISKRLGAQNDEIKAEIVAYDLATSETQKSLLEAHKRERWTLRKSNDTEKKVGDLKRQTAHEKQKLVETAQRMQQINETQEKAKIRLRQEEVAKAQAHALLLEEKRLNRLEKENSKRRLASVKQELDMNYRRMMDDINRLQAELSQLKAAHDSSTASSSSVVASSVQSRRHPSFRQCIICCNNDVCILFLPCAHHVICSDCNEEVFEVLENHCPCCKAQIEKRVKIYGPSS